MFRIAGPNDLDALYRFEILCFREHRFRRDHVDWILRNERALTLVEDGRKAVTAAMMLLFEGHVCRVLSVAVATQTPRHRVVAPVLSAPVGRCRARGMTRIQES